MRARDKSDREEGRGEWVTANLRRAIQERAEKRPEELALEEARVSEHIGKKKREDTVTRVEVRNEEGVVDRRSGLGKKTDWMELLEVAREKDTGTKEENRERAGHGVDRSMSEGKGKGGNRNQERKGRWWESGTERKRVDCETGHGASHGGR